MDIPSEVVEAAAEGIGHDSDCSDVRTPSGLCTCGSVGTARAALAAASGPWAEHLDAARTDNSAERKALSFAAYMFATHHPLTLPTTTQEFMDWLNTFKDEHYPHQEAEHGQV